MTLDRRNFLVGAGGLAIAPALPALAAEPEPTPRNKLIMLLPCIYTLRDSCLIIRHNTQTYIHRHMMRWDLKKDTIQYATVGSELYAKWLREDGPFDIKPHILFGGCVTPDRKGDPHFHDQWKKFARTLA